MQFRIAETYMFDTCTHRCGYCWLAESGQVLDARQLQPFRDPAFIDQIAEFFNSRTSESLGWQLVLSGGEPLLAPNLERLCASLMAAGNRVAFYTGLLVPETHPGFKYLLKTSAPQVDYIMASLHPEGELDQDRYFAKIAALKARGHNVIVRYVGQPSRLSRLEDVEQRCRDLDVAFYPTTLLSKAYPQAYTPGEREELGKHFTSLSQHIQLAGGLRTEALSCHAGSQLIAVNLQTGNITPCVTVAGPSLGNLFTNTLELSAGPSPCPVASQTCVCDVHFQQDVVVGAGDSSAFTALKHGFVAPATFHTPASLASLPIYAGTAMNMGSVADDTRPFFTADEIKARWRAGGGKAAALGRCDIAVTLPPAGRTRAVAKVTIERTSIPLKQLEIFVNAAADGTTSGDWRPIYSAPTSGHTAAFNVAIDTASLESGAHRLALNAHFDDGSTCYWYNQPPIQFQLAHAADVAQVQA